MMKLSRNFGVGAALALFSAVAVQAGDRQPLPEGSYQVAQATDPRVYQLEEQVRDLNGKVEELNFQILQLQEQMRVMQEDNEFRFQQLEGTGSGDGLGGSDTGSAEPMEMEDPSSVAGTTGTGDRPLTALPDGGSSDGATQPRDLGSLTVDEQGNVTGGDIDFSEQGVGSAIDGSAVASVGDTSDPQALYTQGYDYVLNGDYSQAEQVFRTFTELYPNEELAGDAQFWLGESVRAQGRLDEAAEIFIARQKAYPDSKKAAETLLKIGTIMNDLGNRELACVTFSDAQSRYPDMSPTVRERIRDAQSKAQC